MGVVQLVERWFREPEDFSQVRVLPLIHKFDFFNSFRVVMQLVAYVIWDHEVVGSSPAYPTHHPKPTSMESEGYRELKGSSRCPIGNLL